MTTQDAGPMERYLDLVADLGAYLSGSHFDRILAFARELDESRADLIAALKGIVVARDARPSHFEDYQQGMSAALEVARAALKKAGVE